MAGFRRRREEIRRRRDKEDETLEVIARTTKMCPAANCGNRIMRNGGCAHFKCGSCGIEFCWCCKVIFPGRMPRHLNTCVLKPRSTVRKSDLPTEDFAPGWDVDQGYDMSLDGGLFMPGNFM